MEDWYQQQDYFTDVRMSKIQAWINQGAIDIFAYNTDTVVPRLAAG